MLSVTRTTQGTARGIVRCDPPGSQDNSSPCYFGFAGRWNGRSIEALASVLLEIS